MVGDRISAMMVRAGVRTPYELSQRSGVPQPTISRILRGVSREPRRSTLRKIAQAMGVGVAELLGLDGAAPRPDRSDHSQSLPSDPGLEVIRRAYEHADAEGRALMVMQARRELSRKA